MTRILYGGSFNPIHVGHLLVSRAVAEARGFDRVVLVPSSQPPHKPHTVELAEAVHRLKMCQLVASDDPFFEVESLEIDRAGPSYTIDTVSQLRHRGWGEVHWLIGADMLNLLPKWHRAAELIHQATFWIARRPGFPIDWETLPAPFQVLRKQIVEIPQIELGATTIRHRVRAGHSIRFMVPPTIERYIHEHRLYIR